MVRTAAPILSLAALALLALGCGDREENEARLFLDRVARIHVDAPTAERRRQLESLESLALQTEEVAALRDVCVEGHTLLVEAEEAQEGARARLRALSGGDPRAPVPPEERGRIEEAIERSTAGISESRGRLTDCRDGTLALERRHGGGR